MVLAHCGQKMQETERRSQKSGKADENPCSEGGNNEKSYSALLTTTIYAFYTSWEVVCALKTSQNESWYLHSAVLRFQTARSDSDVHRFAGGRPTSEMSETRLDRNET
jgi:hypothetical protein